MVITDSDLPSAGAEEALLEAAGLAVERAACRTSVEVAAAWYSPQALTELPRPATQQVTEFLAGAAVPNLVNTAAHADRTLEAGASAPAPTPRGGP